MKCSAIARNQFSNFVCLGINNHNNIAQFWIYHTLIFFLENFHCSLIERFFHHTGWYPHNIVHVYYRKHYLLSICLKYQFMNLFIINFSIITMSLYDLNILWKSTLIWSQLSKSWQNYRQ